MNELHNPDLVHTFQFHVGLTVRHLGPSWSSITSSWEQLETKTTLSVEHLVTMLSR